MILSIIIVSWNGKEMLRGCLMSIKNNVGGPSISSAKGGLHSGNMIQQYSLSGAERSEAESKGSLYFEVFVVDNGSADGTPEMVRNEFPQVKLIINEKNLGFAKANNQGIKQAQGDFILLLNQDMVVLPGTLLGMVEFMCQHPEAGVGGCHLVDNSGKTVPHARGFPTVFDQAAIILKLPHLFPHLLDKYLMADFDYNKEEPQAVDSIRGSFFMIRRAVLKKIGGLDERFFFFFEEVDYCRRVKEAGWKIMYNPKAKCLDLVGQSVKKMNYQRQGLFLRSMVGYFKKWKPWWQWLVLDILRPIGVVMVWAGDFIQGNIKTKKHGNKNV